MYGTVGKIILRALVSSSLASWESTPLPDLITMLRLREINDYNTIHQTAGPNEIFLVFSLTVFVLFCFFFPAQHDI